MVDPQSSPDATIARFREQLATARYAGHTTKHYLVATRRFLRFATTRSLSLETVEPADVSRYLRSELRRYRRRHGHAPPSVARWCARRAAGVHQLLRAVRRQWPPRPPALSPADAVCSEYAHWLRAQRGLAEVTVDVGRAEARRYLAWYRARAGGDDLQGMTISEVDAYLQARAPSLRRTTRKAVAQRLRAFLRFLHASRRIRRDLAPSVVAPTLYAYEGIPSALRPEEIRAVLTTTRKDRTAKGLRDSAILMLLATYGLRAGEVTRLRLEDIDWRADRLWVRHTKTGAHSALPLLRPVGDALLAYLRRGRPLTAAREIFIRARAPYRAFRRGSSLYAPIRRRLAAAGVCPRGKRGPHAFRHARAVSLLRAGVSPKAIGDLLGHRSAASTMPYLKLATEELRAVALEIPQQEAHP